MKPFDFLIALVALLLGPSLSLAQMPGGMSQEKMQQMMEGMKMMQDCMANIDQTEMQKFQAKAQAMQGEVKALCTGGKRDEAMSRAMAFGKESASNTALQAMQKCGGGMQGMLPQLAAQTIPGQSHEKPRHICDSFGR
jgi:hypothetical protein